MKNARLYAPHVKVGNRWRRAKIQMISGFTLPSGEAMAFRKEVAIEVYQNWLLAPFLQGVDEVRELRPVKPARIRNEVKSDVS